MNKLIPLACALLLTSFSVAFADAPENLNSVITNFHIVTPEIYRGARPSAAAVEALAKAGVRTIIDLQGGDRDTLGGLAGLFEPGELQKNIDAEGDEAKKSGMTFLNYPLNSLHDITPDEETEINDVLNVMNDPQSQPVYVHCEHGKDRTGLVVALYRVLMQGWSPKAAHDEMIADGHSGIGKVVTSDMDEYFYKRTGVKPESR